MGRDEGKTVRREAKLREFSGGTGEMETILSFRNCRIWQLHQPVIAD